MKHPLITIVFALLLLSTATACVPGIPSDQPRVVEGVIIVKLDEHINVPPGALATGVPSIDRMISETQVYAIKQIFPYLEHSSLAEASRLTRFYYFHYGSSVSPLDVVRGFLATLPQMHTRITIRNAWPQSHLRPARIGALLT